MLLSLLYKAMQADPVHRRVAAFVKRLLQVCFYAAIPGVVGVAYSDDWPVRHNHAWIE